MGRILEVDGPAMAYFEYNGGICHYETLTVAGDNPFKLSEELLKTIEYKSENKKIIIWRCRPKIETINDEEGFPTGKFRAIARMFFA